MSILVLASANLADAKSRILLLGGTPESCRTQLQEVRATLNSLPLPENWTFVVACSPTVWENLLRRTDGLGKTHTAFTNLKAQYTYFNGSAFERRVAAHELGHILSKTDDDAEAERLGVELLRTATFSSVHKK